MNKIENMNKEEIRKIWKKYKKEKREKEKLKLKNDIIELYYPLVKKIAYGLADKLNWNVLPDALTSFGIDGLYIAIDKFDLSRNIKFESYASIRIRGSMIDGIRREDYIPRSVRINNRTFEQTRVKLEVEKGRRVDEMEIINEMGIVEEAYFKNTKKYNPATFSSIDNPVFLTKNSDYQKDVNSELIDKRVNNTWENIERKEFFSKLVGKNFSKIEKKIIYLYYYKNLTMEEIAENINISESRISQIHRDLMPRLKNKILRNPKYFADDIRKFKK
jgi:RNA polymerase sigma factor FliA